MIRRLSVLLFMLGCVGCLTMRSDNIQKVNPGMNQATVQKLMGAPDDRSVDERSEVWRYNVYNYNSGPTVKIIEFQDAKVVSVRTDESATMRAAARYEAEADRRAAIQAARESATRITVTNSLGHSGSLAPCEHRNTYGQYPSGGGCNIYGCYPAGGRCNVYGCSWKGHCGVHGCPSKIRSGESICARRI